MNKRFDLNIRLQDRLYEIDRSWQNNLVFYGIKPDHIVQNGGAVQSNGGNRFAYCQTFNSLFTSKDQASTANILPLLNTRGLDMVSKPYLSVPATFMYTRAKTALNKRSKFASRTSSILGGKFPSRGHREYTMGQT